MTHLLVSLRMTIAFAVLITFALPACTQTKDIEFKQLAVGFNGPKYPKVFYFENKNSIDSSWIKSALPMGEYERILSKVEFGRQALVVFAIGERMSASGNVEITRMFQYRGKDFPTNISALVGIRASECTEKSGFVSYPFVVAVFEKPENFQPYGGFDAGNFSDGCGAEVKNSPSVLGH